MFPFYGCYVYYSEGNGDKILSTVKTETFDKKVMLNTCWSTILWHTGPLTETELRLRYGELLLCPGLILTSTSKEDLDIYSRLLRKEPYELTDTTKWLAKYLENNTIDSLYELR